MPLERRREGERVRGVAGWKRILAAVIRAFPPGGVLQRLRQRFGHRERLNQVHAEVRHFRLVFDASNGVDDRRTAQERTQLSEDLSGLEDFLGGVVADQCLVDVVIERGAQRARVRRRRQPRTGSPSTGGT
jgi:hypothetical protein